MIGTPLSEGEHTRISRFLQACFNAAPLIPQKNPGSWDVNILLDHLQALGNNNSLTINQLGGKCLILILLSTMCRSCELLLLKLSNMSVVQGGIEFILDKLTKTYNRNNFKFRKDLQKLTLSTFDSNKTLCPVQTLIAYIECTAPFRRQVDEVFICCLADFVRPATKDTLNRWIKTHMTAAGLGEFQVKSHRHASSTIALLSGIPIDKLIAQVGWSTTTTFVSNYMTPLLDNVLQKTYELSKDTAIISDIHNFTEVWQKQPKRSNVTATSHIKQSAKFVKSQSKRMVKAHKQLAQASVVVTNRAMDKFSPNAGKVRTVTPHSKKIRGKINLTTQPKPVVQAEYGAPIDMGHGIKIVPVTRVVDGKVPTIKSCHPPVKVSKVSGKITPAISKKKSKLPPVKKFKTTKFDTKDNHDNILPLFPDLQVEKLVPEIDGITEDDINTIITLLEKPNECGTSKTVANEHPPVHSKKSTEKVKRVNTPVDIASKGDNNSEITNNEDTLNVGPFINNLDVLTEACENAERLKTDSSGVTLTSATTDTCAPVTSSGQAMFVNKPVCDGLPTATNSNALLDTVPVSSTIIPQDTEGPVAIHNPHEHPVVVLLPQHLAAYQPVVNNDTMNQLAFKNQSINDRCDTCYPPVLQYEFLGDDYSTCKPKNYDGRIAVIQAANYATTMQTETLTSSKVKSMANTKKNDIVPDSREWSFGSRPREWKARPTPP